MYKPHMCRRILKLNKPAAVINKTANDPKEKGEMEVQRPRCFGPKQMLAVYRVHVLEEKRILDDGRRCVNLR